MSACRHIRCQSDADAYAWDGVRWARLCGDHLAGLARVVDLGVYTVAWDVDVDGPPPPNAGPTRKVVDNLDTPAPKPTPTPTPKATTPAAPVADTDTDTAPEPPCTSSTSLPASSAPAPSGSDAGASPGPAAESSPSPSADPPPKRKPGGSKPKFPTVTRRTDDAPGLCLNIDCPSPRKSRGMCHRCFERADRQGVLDAVALPKLSPSEVSRLALAAKHTPKDPPMPPRRPALALRANPDTTSKLCRIAGCGKPTKARGFCSSDLERVREAGRLDELGLPPKSGATNTRAKPALAHPDAGDPIQKIRVILGCDLDGADEEVVDRARLFVEFRDGVEGAVNAAGIPGFMLLGEIVNAVSAIAGERVRARDEVRAAHTALDAMPASSAPDCDTPAQRIRYATSAWLDERKDASSLAQLCQNAHETLDAAEVPNEGTPAERIRRLVTIANRRAEEAVDLDLHQLRDALGLDARTPDLTVIRAAVDRVVDGPPKPTRGPAAAVTELFDHMHEAAEDNIPVSPHVVAALRALVGVPS